MKVRIGHINVVSAFRVGMVVSGMAYLPLGLGALILEAALGSLAGLPLPILPLPPLAIYAVGFPIVALGSGVGLALVAWLYNRTLPWTGGVQLRIVLPSMPLLEELGQ